MRILVIIAVVVLILWLGVGAFFNLAIGLTGVIISLIPWAIVGWVAGRLVTGGGYGAIGNVLLGIIGGVVGGFIFSLFNIGDPSSGLLGTIVSGVVGAIIMIFVWRAIRSRRITT
jgi:uncharacterized membrane protein YeaQ/YmgE (transglycosylase-associated protein family)